MVKIGRGQQNYRRCRRRRRLQTFVMMKTTVLSDQQWTLFIHIFQFDFGCTLYLKDAGCFRPAFQLY
jgi:hypothetical protein